MFLYRILLEEMIKAKTPLIIICHTGVIRYGTHGGEAMGYLAQKVKGERDR